MTSRQMDGRTGDSGGMTLYMMTQRERRQDESLLLRHLTNEGSQKVTERFVM